MRRALAFALMIALGAGGVALAKSSPPPLTAYIGRYPSDKVKGVAWLKHPQVLAAISAAVPEGEIRDQIFKGDVVSMPIRETRGRLLSGAYDPVGAGVTNWAILMVADGSKAAICYGGSEGPEGRSSDWYLDGEKVFTLYTQCPSKPEDIEGSLGDWPIGAIPG